MADNLSDYAENKILDHSLGTTSWTMPTSIQIALYTTATDDTTGGTEVSGGSYARQTVTFDSAASGATQNAADIVFPQATANWGTVSHIALYDQLSNRIWHGALTASKQIDSGDQFKILDGELDITIS